MMNVKTSKSCHVADRYVLSTTPGPVGWEDVSLLYVQVKK